jgi:hypothetical protein
MSLPLNVVSSVVMKEVQKIPGFRSKTGNVLDYLKISKPFPRQKVLSGGFAIINLR